MLAERHADRSSPIGGYGLRPQAWVSKGFASTVRAEPIRLEQCFAERVRAQGVSSKQTLLCRLSSADFTPEQLKDNVFRIARRSAGAE